MQFSFYAIGPDMDERLVPHVQLAQHGFSMRYSFPRVGICAFLPQYHHLL